MQYNHFSWNYWMCSKLDCTDNRYDWIFSLSEVNHLRKEIFNQKSAFFSWMFPSFFPHQPSIMTVICFYCLLQNNSQMKFSFLWLYLFSSNHRNQPASPIFWNHQTHYHALLTSNCNAKWLQNQFSVSTIPKRFLYHFIFQECHPLFRKLFCLLSMLVVYLF